MNIKKTVASALVGLTLVAGGTAATLATWQTSASSEVGRIQTGSMEVSISDLQISDWLEISQGRARRLSTFDGVSSLSDFRMVPGNWIRGEFPVTGTLVGHDLRATFSFNLDGAGNVAPNGDVVTIPENGGRVSVNGRETNIEVHVRPNGWGGEFTPDTVANAGTSSAGGRRAHFDIRFIAGELTDADMDVIANLGNLKVTLTQAVN